MKKIQTLLKGIAVIMAVMAVGACNPEADNGNSEEYPEKVTIYLKAVEIDGEWHLEMYDSKNPDKVVIDDLVTYVGPGTKVVWRRTKDSGIKVIEAVSPKTDGGPIFPGDAKTILLKKRYRVEARRDAPVPTGEQEYIEEAYNIVFVEKQTGKEIEIDPHLRIPRQSAHQ